MMVVADGVHGPALTRRGVVALLREERRVALERRSKVEVAGRGGSEYRGREGEILRGVLSGVRRLSSVVLDRGGKAV